MRVIVRLKDDSTETAIFHDVRRVQKNSTMRAVILEYNDGDEMIINFDEILTMKIKSEDE